MSGGPTVLAAANTAYLITNDIATTITLPSSATVGDLITIVGEGAGGWTANAALLQWIPRENQRNWSGIAASGDGKKIVATVNGGAIYRSGDAGVTWTATPAPNTNWNAIACSGDGRTVIASVSSGPVYVSKDSGATWRECTTLGAGSWAVAASGDGSTLAALKTGTYVAPGSGIFLSTDSGATWQQTGVYGSYLVGVNWSSITLSYDGTEVLACAWQLQYWQSLPYPPYQNTWYDGGYAYKSSDGGAFTANGPAAQWVNVALSTNGVAGAGSTSLGYTYSSTNGWGSVCNIYPHDLAMSANGDQMFAAANGKVLALTNYTGSSWSWTEVSTPGNATFQMIVCSYDGSVQVAGVSGGQLYTRSAKLFEGAQGRAITLQYVGDGKWQPVNETQPSSIGAAQLAESAVTSAAIANGAVGSAQLASNLIISGTLNLGSNGLSVGSSQLVVSNSNVGIGMANPVSKLQVAGGDLGLGDGTVLGNQAITIWLTNASGAVRSAGEIVIIGASNNCFTVTATSASTATLGVVYDAAITNGAVGRIAIGGVAFAQSAGATTCGQHVITSTTSGKAGSDPNPVSGASIGKWLESGPAAGNWRVLLK